MNKYINESGGSKLLFWMITLGDIILAICTFFILRAFNLTASIPPYLEHSLKASLLSVVLATVIAIACYSTIITERRISIVEVILRVIKLCFVQAAALIIIARILGGRGTGYIRFTIYFFAAYFTLMLLLRFTERLIINKLRQRGRNYRKVVFIGSGGSNVLLYRNMKENGAIGYYIEGYYGNDPMGAADGNEVSIDEIPHLGTLDQLLIDIKAGKRPIKTDEVYCCVSHNERETLSTIMDYCDNHVIQFFYVPRIYGNLSMHLTPVMHGDYALFTNFTNNINRIDNRVVKRTFDIIFSSIICLLILPLIPIIWIIIRIQSPGPLFFAQKRTGVNGEEFMCYKFRSMHVNKDADKLQATKDDPRKFPFGEFMRKTNIDELPQFFNVLKGDMSVVGPRPHMLLHTDKYSELIQGYMVRHFSKPGITGWAQVTGYRGETKELWQMEERIRRDIWYNENWSIALDIEIIFRTIWSVIHPDKNAY